MPMSLETELTSHMIRRTGSGEGWWFTVRWMETEHDERGTTERICCYDSTTYTDYRACARDRRKFVQQFHVM